jgi:hypothetical protein
MKLELRTYLAPSKVCDGVGVFSLVDIPKDTEYILWTMVDAQLHERIATLTYYDENGFWIDSDLDKLGPQYYINHSHDPNVAYNKDTGKLYAIKDIPKDVELTDYYFPGERDWLI